MNSSARTPLTDWKEGALTWSTQLNDLRSAESLGSSGDQRAKVLQLELKNHALFQYRTVIRDADLVNHLTFQKLLIEDSDGLQAAVRDGAILLAIRHDAESYTEVNERAGGRRAYPSRLDEARSQLRSVDSFVRDHDIRLVEVRIPNKADVFRDLLARLLASPKLASPEKDTLTQAMQEARELASGGTLRFGDLYRSLIGPSNRQPADSLVQWCRAAHSLTVPASTGIPASTADLDISPPAVAFFLGHGGSTIDSTPWLELFPRRILSESALARLTFADIVRLRTEGFRLGYFDSVVRLHKCVGSAQFEKTFLEYLRTLEQYLIAINLEARVELVDWQKSLANRNIKMRDLRDRAFCWGIPIALSVTYALCTLSPLAISWGAGVAAGVQLLRESRAVRRPPPLVRLVTGTTVQPVI